jgi:lipopolysaccharide/colanic/teichoic acid biosynthesis glycosyltransferase
MAKRLFDLAGSIIGLLVLAPLLLAIAALIKLEDRGPVFYRGERVGRFGKLFRIFKFRTMVASAEKLGGPSTAADDPRITRIGRFLRRYKLDELPQLTNVLRGEMSLVGPRPEVRRYVEMYTEEEKIILTVRPGITDWATLWNSDEGAVLAGSPDPDRAYEEKIRPTKVRLQLEYVRNQSLLVDLKILLQTVAALVTKKPPAALGSADPRRC